MERAKKLQRILTERSALTAESLHLIAATCTLIIARMEKIPITFEEMANISHIKKNELIKFHDTISDQIIIILKSI